MARIYGEIVGNPPGTTYDSRREAWAAGVHRETQGGISGDESGSESIVVSGGYDDDEDHGDVIVYTGQGGRDLDTGKQIADQQLTKRNLGLARSHIEGLPVRVVRGAGGDKAFAPTTGYRYDGLFYITDCWQKVGQEGFKIWQYRLVKEGSSDTVDVEQWNRASRVETTVQRIARNTAMASKVKAMHEYACQICGLRLETLAGPYAEAAHIRALGAPHHGPDTVDNILCLCPNHHVLFDTGGIYIDEDRSVHHGMTHEAIGRLHTIANHQISQEHLDYHRQHYIAS